MTAAKHTPGPWTIREPNGAGHGVSIPEIGAWFGTMAWAPETMANARLCASAPDLLEALEELRSAVADLAQDEESSVTHCENLMRKARLAIAKARGGA